MRRIHLLRHAMPDADPTTPSNRWPLSSAGVAACATLVGRLPEDAVRLSSAEVKAQQTLTLLLPGPYLVDPGLNEVHRPGEPWSDSVRSGRRAWIMGARDERHRGWETMAAAAARVDHVCARWADNDLVLATHGMVITAWLVGAGRLRAGPDAMRFWERLAFPDLITVEASSWPQRIKQNG